MTNAIEVHYYASKLAFYLSGGAISSNDAQNPTLAALIESSPPPSTNKAEAQDTKDQQGSAGDAIASTNPISQTVRIDLAIQQENRNVEINTYIEEAFLEDLAALAEAEAEQNQQEIDDLYEEIQEEIEEEVEGIDEPSTSSCRLDSSFTNGATSGHARSRHLVRPDQRQRPLLRRRR